MQSDSRKLVAVGIDKLVAAFALALRLAVHAHRRWRLAEYASAERRRHDLTHEGEDGRWPTARKVASEATAAVTPVAAGAASAVGATGVGGPLPLGAAGALRCG